MARPRTTTPTKPKDQRVQRSIELLSAALLELLESRSLEEISIRDITAQAGIGYATFFRRFSGKDDLLNYIAAEEIQNVLALSLDALTEKNPEQSGLILCQYIQNHRSLWKTLLNGGAAPVMREEFRRAAEEIALTRKRSNPWIPTDLAAPFVTSGIFEILAWWMRQPEDYPAENALTLFEALIVDPLLKPRDITLV